jgi:hypothetical protein
MSTLSRADAGGHRIIPGVWSIVVVAVVAETTGLLLESCRIKPGVGVLALGHKPLHGKTSVAKDAVSLLLLKVGHALCYITNCALRAALCRYAREVRCARAKAIWLSLAKVLYTC